MKIGYYWVKFYNHNRLQMMYFNGSNFEGFKSDIFIHDEIESYIEVDPPENFPLKEYQEPQLKPQFHRTGG